MLTEYPPQRPREYALAGALAAAQHQCRLGALAWMLHRPRRPVDDIARCRHVAAGQYLDNVALHPVPASRLRLHRKAAPQIKHVAGQHRLSSRYQVDALEGLSPLPFQPVGAQWMLFGFRRCAIVARFGDFHALVTVAVAEALEGL